MKASKYLLGLGFGLVACTSGQSAQVPPFTGANLSANVAQLAVGVATFGNRTFGTNLLPTFRQPNGDSATLVNTPTLTGPAAWIVPVTGSPASGVDGGTNSISGRLQVTGGPTNSTFGQTGGVFSYGFQPDNTTTGNAVFSVYAQPFFGSPQFGPGYRGGPPAYPNVRDGTFPAGFFGYTEGFLTLNIPAVAGTYNLSILLQTVGSSGTTNTTFTAAATMASTTPLGVIGPAGIVQDGNGGITVTFTAPPGVTETLVDVVDTQWCKTELIGKMISPRPTVYYTVLVRGAGAQTAVLPANLGPTGTSALTCSSAGRTIVVGDPYTVILVGTDYPIFEAGPPQSTTQTPTLTGAGGQADITLSTAQSTAAY